MSSGQQLRERPSQRKRSPRPPRPRRTSQGWLTPKRAAILGVTFILIGVGTTYVVKTAIENEKQAANGKPLNLKDVERILSGDPFGTNDPESDSLKAHAVVAMKKDALEKTREGAKLDDPVKIVKTSPGGGGFDPVAFPSGSSPDPGSNKAIGKQMAEDRGWGDEWGCLEKLWDRESHWNERAMNRYSGAYGIPQALPGHKMSSAGADWQTNPATQIKWGLGYIAGRYKSPCGAWGHSQSTGWY
ncbi:lytic transglycosylase domain-containing protein [Streptosporangiaceae bacterium NEAU-GS5]|nr:lytic transglycosylase domain-containing protein [Streptosporangiaceae bacterium NEAU-GS5]